MYDSQQNADIISTLTQEFDEVRKKEEKKQHCTHLFVFLDARMEISSFTCLIFASLSCNNGDRGDY